MSKTTQAVSNQSSQTGLVRIGEREFEAEVLRAATPVLVDFYADWCGPCQTQTPILESLAANQSDQIKVVKVDVDQDPNLAKRFGVRSIPTLVLFRQGQAIATGTGVHSNTQLNELIQQSND